jgi:formylglycine-generating enzyme required for sulfatase activity/dienelactone hydrolase
MEDVRFPVGFSRIKAEKQGYQTVYDATTSDQMSTRLYMLDEVNTIPDEMVHIPSVEILINLNLPKYPDFRSAIISDFLIDRYEVTNKDYKKFVDDGGYQKEQYWKHPFIKDGKILSWKEAMSLFVDNTGRNGPSTWEVGDYPEGEANFPVGGISWYEAAAYAEFVGKSLPTVFHWRRAAGLDIRQRIPRLTFHLDLAMGTSYKILQSNFSSQGPAPVGTYQGMTSFGAFDMAGNVREWCWNQSDQSEQRLICGGGWNDPPFMFSRSIYMQSPFDRSQTNGFRCVTHLHADESLDVLRSQIKPYEYRDFRSEKPASDQEFEIYKRMFAYDKTDLNAEIESEDRTNEDWIRQKISYNAAYEDERITAYMFLPKDISPPYQVVIYFPGYSVTRMLSSASLLNMHMIDFVVRDGRAVIYPVYKGTYERRFETGPRPGLIENREFTIKLFKDLSRSIDYLESRSDINATRLAYLGLSWGGQLGPLMVALEDRIKTCVLVVAGLSGSKRLPEVDGFTYVSRVKIPTLMLNGKYDDTFPYETSQKPMFDLLGTSSEHKSFNFYESGHFVPRNQLIKETLDWLDRYLGPVNR